LVRAYPLSELERLVRTSTDRFRARFAHPWLVWEPGSWQIGSPFEQTMMPGDDEADIALRRTESLAFALDFGAGPQFLRIGRATDCDVVVNDATVSREHLALTRDLAGQWRVEPLTDGYTHCREVLAVGQSRVVVSGDRIRAGEVLLTFYGEVGLMERLGG
jgi:hypothetical protein